MNISKLFLSILSAVIFSFIDALFFLIGEQHLQNIFKNNIGFVDENVAELMTGGISAALSILLFNIIKHYINKHFEIYEYSFIDTIGIIIGTAIVIGFYILFKKV